jgi:hypothetical protein
VVFNILYNTINNTNNRIEDEEMDGIQHGTAWAQHGWALFLRVGSLARRTADC